MSELIQKHDNRATIRWKLLAGTSALALTAYISSASLARADGADRSTLWIELGGQLEGLSNAQEEPYMPPFAPLLASEGMLPASRVQTPPHFGLAADGSISFQPEDSNWVFSASIHYGRSQSGKKQHQQTPNRAFPVHFSYYGYYQQIGTKYPSSHVKFENASAKQSERHLILDFQAGKDVGLGLFGKGASSVLSAGVRIAQFSSKANLNMRVEPDVHYPTAPITTFPAFIAWYVTNPPVIRFHDYAVTADEERSFRGIGPSVSWNASTPFAGNSDNGELTVDWGVNAALLFGRQKASGHSQTITKTFYKQHFESNGYSGGVGNAGTHNGRFLTASIVNHSNPVARNRTRSVTVPNLGGFAGLSMRYSDLKLSIGYRADFFFGAIDGGIDTRKEENRGFFGPYASISVGLGD